MELKLKKGTVMKKIIAFIALSIAMVSCYEDYIVDYVYTAVYFPYTQNVRTFVVGEGMKFEVGATLGGVSDNTRDRNVDFILDNTLVTPAQLVKMQTSSMNHIKNATAGVVTLQQLPATHYTMTPSTTVMVIKKGWYSGTVVIKADSVNFCNDSVNTTKKSTYVLPFRITAADADSILPAKQTQVVGTMLEHKLYGNYWHGGWAIRDRSSASLPNDTVKYYTTIPALENKIWTMTTLGPQTLTINSYFNAVSGTTAQIKLVLKNGNVYLSSVATSAYTFTPDGPCVYNNPKLLQDRRIFLNYKFTNPVDGFTYHCTDTLRFRNRLRDGVNEWQDENPSHYTK
jgi:hypothetical protein